jgi:hypothetical protein
MRLHRALRGDLRAPPPKRVRVYTKNKLDLHAQIYVVSWHIHIDENGTGSSSI